MRAQKLAPKNTDTLLLMARLSMKQSFYEDAIPQLSEAIKIDPRRADLHAALGESYFTVGKVLEAFEEFKSLLGLDPSARSYAFMGLYYRHLGRFEEVRGDSPFRGCRPGQPRFGRGAVQPRQYPVSES